MKMYLLFITLGLQACSSVSGKSISFTETDAASHIVRKLAFVLTDQPGHACISGDWMKATPITDSQQYTQDPVYKVEKGNLEVLLKNGYCDAYDSYIGQFSDGEFKGEHVIYGWGSTTLGTVTGVQAE